MSAERHPTGRPHVIDAFVDDRQVLASKDHLSEHPVDTAARLLGEAQDAGSTSEDRVPGCRGVGEDVLVVTLPTSGPGEMATNADGECSIFTGCAMR